MSSRSGLSTIISRVLLAVMLLANLIGPLPAQAATAASHSNSVASKATMATATATPRPTPTRSATIAPTPAPSSETDFAGPAGSQRPPRSTVGTSTAAPSTTQSATSGSILRSFTVPNPNGYYNGRAVAFDGTNLWYTFDPTRNPGATYIYEASTAGTLIQTLNPGIGFGALAWDSKRGVLWGGTYDGRGNFYQISPSTGVATYAFTFVPSGGNCPTQPPGSIDGLAYDPATDTLWVSDDEGNEVFNLSVTGAQISSFGMTGPGYGCNSGIAIEPYQTGGESLWLAAAGYNLVVHDDLSGDPLRDGFYESSTCSANGCTDSEGLAFDAVTFAPDCAVWANNAGPPDIAVALTAYQVPCGPSLPVEDLPTATNHNPPLLNSAAGGDPVNTYTGNYTYTHVDLSIPGRGPSPVFSRSYNSDDTRVTPLGPGWTSNYFVRLRGRYTAYSDVVAVGPQGRSDVYAVGTGGAFVAPPAVYTSLVQNADDTWTTTDKDQSTRTFDSQGRLIKLRDRYGNQSDLTYDGSGNLISVSDPAGRGSLAFSYDGNGRLTSVSDWLSPPRVVRFDYDAQGRLWHVTDRDGQVTTYGYDGTTSHLTTITDANGHVAITNTYDSNGRVATQKDALGLTTGQQTTFSYVRNQDGSQTTTITYPAESFDGAQPVVTDTYDTSGRLTQRVTQPTKSTQAKITQSYSYDANSNLSTFTDGNGHTTTYCYDVDYSGAPIPGSSGNLTRKIEPAPTAGANVLVTLYRYDAHNNLIETIPPKGVSSGTSATCTTDFSSSITLTYATDNTYDANGVDLLAVTRTYTDPDLGPQTATTKFEYNDPANPGLVTRVIPPRGNTGPSPDYSYATTYTYYTSASAPSQAGMLQSVVDPMGNTTTYTYDVVGRRLTMVDPDGNASGGDPAAHTWSYSYDNEDRLLTSQAPAPTTVGSPLTTTYQYDPVGNRTIQIDANGQVTKYVYDARDSLAQVLESPNPWTDPNATPSPEYVTAYQYDNLGNLTRVVRAQGDSSNERVTDYSYDGLNRLRQETQYPSWPSTRGSLVTQYTYDGNNNRLTLKDPLGKTTTYGYDALNRLTSIDYSDHGTADVAYAYDPNGNRASMVDGTGTTTYAYDELDRLTSVTSPGAQTVGYRYDLDGNRTKVIYPDGTAVTYTFNKASQLASLADWANPARTVSYGYLPDGHLQTVTNFNGTSATYSYDNAQRLTQVLNQQGSTVISQHTYTLDNVGNRTALVEMLAQVGGGTTTNTIAYSYDRLYRLTGDGTRSYSYDPVGNRLTQNTTNYTYDRADRILTAGSVSYTVNANGNVTARGSDSFSYDQANRLTSATVSGTTTTYRYDGDGKRASQTVGGSTTSYVYDPNKALPDVLTDGTLKYVYGLSLAYAVDTSGNVQVYHADGLGSVRALTDGSGTLIQTYRTDPFGVPTQTQGSSTQPFQFTGQQRDGNGLIYLRARYYDPAAGRFMSRDTFPGVPFVPSSLNRYVYVQDRPSVLSDPTGQCLPFCAAPAIAGALEGGADVGITIAAGGALLSEYLIIIHHDDIGQSLDRLWSLIQDFGPPAQQIKIRVTNSATGDVIGELDTETGLVTGFQPQRKITSTTGTPPEFPVPPEPHYDRNAPWYNKLVFILAKLSDIISNLPH